MNKELVNICTSLETIVYGDPWYGKSFMAICKTIHPVNAYVKPNDKGHSLIELIYHCINWTEFTLSRMDPENTAPLESFDQNDWRVIDPAVHTWEAGLASFDNLNRQLLERLAAKTDEFLDEPVKGRSYSFRQLLQGLIQHHIYHLGQIAYVKSLELN